ncbi:WhiB family transcriptional regulator [Kocuria flava]|nr:WhiB family transcriptional regulator [Kocuria flava]GEO93099.1 hypothetical protein KFL01_24050 [Kocuria flava]
MFDPDDLDPAPFEEDQEPQEPALPQMLPAPQPVPAPPDAAAHEEFLALLEVLMAAGCLIPCLAAEDRTPWLADGRHASAAAARACQDCPALTECAAYALAAQEPSGVWGGMTLTDRTATRSRSITRKVAAA